MNISQKEMQKRQRKASPVKSAWTVVQIAVFAIGVLILAMLLVQPKLGLFLLWDVLIPIAPLLLVIAPGVWRNICPMATFSMLPHRFNVSRRKPLPVDWQAYFFMAAVLLLFLIVPLRHAVLDRYGVVTGVVLLVVAIIVFCLGLIFDWKAAWCSGLCPVHPVELLYGARPVVTVPNMQCRTCTNCVVPCRDSKKGSTPLEATRQKYGRWAVLIFIGCFPGFVFGWFTVSLSLSMSFGTAIFVSYFWPYAAAAVTLIIFLILTKLVGNRSNLLVRLYAAVAVSIYYWFKLPVMFGLSGDGSHALLPVGDVAPDWSIWLLRLMVIALFGYLLLARPGVKAWTTPPRPAKNPSATLS